MVTFLLFDGGFVGLCFSESESSLVTAIAFLACLRAAVENTMTSSQDASLELSKSMGDETPTS